MQISPSILAADFLNLQKEIEILNISKADYIHLDIMDGAFVPNITFGMPIIKQIKSIAKKPLDVHLMIENPEKYLQEFKDAGANILTIHYETVSNLAEIINEIQKLGILAGVAINPSTDIHLLEKTIKYIDIVLVMSVNPGFYGQSFIENTYNKVMDIREIIKRNNSKAKIEVDGGINLDNAIKLAECGADILVAANSIYSTQNVIETIDKFKNIQAS